MFVIMDTTVGLSVSSHTFINRNDTTVGPERVHNAESSHIFINRNERFRLMQSSYSSRISGHAQYTTRVTIHERLNPVLCCLQNGDLMCISRRHLGSRVTLQIVGVVLVE